MASTIRQSLEIGARASEPVDVQDMNPKVFAAVLWYIYIGSAAASAEEEEELTVRPWRTG